MLRLKKKAYVLIAVILTVSISLPFIYAYKEAVAFAAFSDYRTPDISYSRYDDIISDAEESKKEYEEKAAELKAEIDGWNSEYNDILAYIDELDAWQDELSTQVIDINNKLELLEEEKAATELQLAEATETMNNQYAIMSARIKYVYENGETSYWDLIVNSASLADLLNRVEYISEISEYDDNLFKDYQETAKKVSEYNDALAIQISALEELKVSYEYYLEESEVIKAEKNTALEEYATKLGVSEELLEEYLVQIATEEMTIAEAQAAKDEEARLAKEAEEKAKAEEEAKKQAEKEQEKNNNEFSEETDNDEASEEENDNDDGNSGEVSSYGLIWPVPGHGTVSSYFGYRESPGAGASTYHKGIDIPAPFGTSIVAVASGTATTGRSWDRGNYVMIDHGDGMVTMYYHCSSLAVSNGDYVSQGQTIGHVGNTGVSYGNHLHFGITLYGVYKNPLNYVAY